jgi:hypothetical protein
MKHSDIDRAIVACVLLRTCLPAPGVAAEFYVAPTGMDASPGTKQQPVATLQRAQEQVHRLDVRGKQPVAVWVQPGTYYVGQSLLFGPEDSGTKDAPITWQAVKDTSIGSSMNTVASCGANPVKPPLGRGSGGEGPWLESRNLCPSGGRV